MIDLNEDGTCRACGDHVELDEAMIAGGCHIECEPHLARGLQCETAEGE